MTRVSTHLYLSLSICAAFFLLSFSSLLFSSVRSSSGSSARFVCWGAKNISLSGLRKYFHFPSLSFLLLVLSSSAFGRHVLPPANRFRHSFISSFSHSSIHPLIHPFLHLHASFNSFIPSFTNWFCPRGLDRTSAPALQRQTHTRERDRLDIREGKKKKQGDLHKLTRQKRNQGKSLARSQGVFHSK